MRQPLKHQFQNELEKCPVVKEKLTPEGEDKRFIFQAAKLGVYAGQAHLDYPVKTWKR